VVSGLQFNLTGGVLGFTVNSSRSPADAYTFALADGRVTRWTESEIGGLNPATLVEPELIRYPTFDHVDGKPRMIPAYYYRGKGDGPRPVVIFAHGGPESQFVAGFVSNFQYWACELGISVIAPNVRGSTGYGRSYHQLDDGVKREDSVKDIGALLDWIAKQPELDAKRVGIYGGSYGGYVVLASLMTYPDRFKAGIDVVGIASFITFLENTPIYRRDLRREEYGDERDAAVREVLDAISPLKHAAKIAAALFVLHGKNDARVPYTEAEQIVAKMRELGRPAWYALALNEGHGFQKKENIDLAAVLYALFWSEHLLR
jgi:dipeptidyl aminopeptidase/acylaminoacyl peptidase